MNTFRKFFRLLIGFGAVLTGCQTGDLTVGQQIIAPDMLHVQVVDTITVQSATVLTDTFATYTDDNVLTGRWVDANTGRTTAKGFVSIGYTANALASQTNVVYDSLVLVLPIGFAYGDTLGRFTLNVYRLTSLFKTRAYSNLSAIDHEPTPWLSQVVTAGSSSNGGQYRLRLPAAVQQDFVRQLTNRTIENQEELDAYLKGFAIGATPPANVLVGLNVTSASAGLTLYYHTTDLTPVNASLVFPFRTQDAQVQTTHFSQVVTDRSGTTLAGLTSRTDAIDGSKTGNRTFVAPSAQLTTRLTLPSLDRYALGAGQFRGVNHAELILEPVWPNTRDNAAPFGTLALYQTNDSNQLTDINGAAIGIVSSGDGTTASAQLLNYTPNALIPEPEYHFNLTYYVNQLIQKQVLNRPLLVTTSQQPTLQSLAQRLTLGNAGTAQYRLRLVLYVSTEQ